MTYSLSDAICRGIPAKIALQTSKKWLNPAAWCPEFLNANMPERIVVKRQIGNPHFMYAEGAHRHLLADDRAGKTELISMSPRRLFELCAQQIVPPRSLPSSSNAYHYFTAPVHELGLALQTSVSDGWQADLVCEPHTCAEFGAKPFVSTWIGGAGSTTTAHYDVLDNVFVQLHGSKRFAFWPPQSSPALLVYPDVHTRARKSQLGSIEEMPTAVSELVVHAGEALYIPSFYFHHVVAEELSISLNAFSLTRANINASSVLATLPPTALLQDVQHAPEVLAATLHPLLMQPECAVEDPLTFLERNLLSRFVPLGLPGLAPSARAGKRVGLSFDGNREVGAVAHKVGTLRAELARTRPAADVDGVVHIVLAHLVELWAHRACLADARLVPQLLLEVTHQMRKGKKGLSTLTGAA